jgi:hypothetical protein
MKTKPLTRYLREFWQRKPITKIKPSGKLYKRKKGNSREFELHHDKQ